jgi:hypothetical protein
MNFYNLWKGPLFVDPKELISCEWENLSRKEFFKKNFSKNPVDLFVYLILMIWLAILIIVSDDDSWGPNVKKLFPMIFYPFSLFFYKILY